MGSNRDDSYVDRLSSILTEKGGLSLRNMFPIKSYIYYLLTTTGEEFIVKGYSKKELVECQWNFFEQWQTKTGIKFVLFPSGEKTINGLGLYWTAAPYRKSKPLSFTSHQSRFSACKVLRQFHEETRGIKMKTPLLKDPLYVKYMTRTKKFSKTEQLMKEHGYGNLYADIFFKTDQLITRLKKFDWHSLERKAVCDWTWTHGDVASHNFLGDTKSDMYLIDFDMLGLSPVIYDWIQLGQRFLPHVNHQLTGLLAHPLPLKEEEMELFLQGICMPADLIREWFYFIARHPAPDLYQSYLQNLEQQWEQRLQLMKEANIILA